jgi:hypothetical protein
LSLLSVVSRQCSHLQYHFFAISNILNLQIELLDLLFLIKICIFGCWYLLLAYMNYMYTILSSLCWYWYVVYISNK